MTDQAYGEQRTPRRVAAIVAAVRRGLHALRRVDVVVWIVLFLGLLAVFIWRERGEIFRIGHVLRTADLGWVIVAVAVELSILVFFAAKNAQLLRLLGHRVGLVPLVEIHLQRQVVSTVVPIGGPASAYIFVRNLGRRGVPADDVILVTAMFGVLGHVSFAVFLAPIIVWLAVWHSASALTLLASALFVLIVVALFGGLMFLLQGGRFPSSVERRLPARVTSFVDQARGHGITARNLIAPLLFALGVDVAGAALLFVSLDAVGPRPSLETAAAGYAVGTLFLLLAPVFQGLGVVELSMAVTLERLGIPKAVAISATLLYRLCELWLPLALGVAIQSGTRRAVRGTSVHLPAVVTGLTGLLSVLSVMAPSLPRHFNRLQRYSPLAFADASRTFTLVAGFLLIFLSFSLWRRKRVAWLAGVTLSAVTIVTHVAKRHDQVVAVLAAVNLALLLLYGRRFRVRSDIPTMRQALVQLAALLGFMLAYGTLGFWLLDKRQFGINFSVADSLTRTLRLFVDRGNPGLRPRTRYADWFLDSFTVVGIVAVSYAVFSLVRPVVWRRRTLPHEREAARQLIAEYGDSSLDLFKTSEDKIYFFSSTRRGVVSYGVAAAVAVALGDPVATHDAEFRLVLREFLDFCDANDWRVAFHQVPATHLKDYQDAGLSALKIGEEAVVDLTRFSLQGHAMKSLRSAVNKIDREGFRAILYEPPHTDETLAKLREVSDEWLLTAGRRERRFTLGRWDDDYVRACPVMTVEDAEGRVYAFANLIPDGVEGEATIDMMRRRSDGPNGMMEVLFVRLFEAMRSQGRTRFSLGMVPFSAVGVEPGSPALERGIRLLGEHLARYFSSKGLREYKDKFRPEWEGRYLIYSSEVALPAITFALVRLTE